MHSYTPKTIMYLSDVAVRWCSYFWYCCVFCVTWCTIMTNMYPLLTNRGQKQENVVITWIDALKEMRLVIFVNIQKQRNSLRNLATRESMAVSWNSKVIVFLFCFSHVITIDNFYWRPPDNLHSSFHLCFHNPYFIVTQSFYCFMNRL